ncbi:MAG: TolC family protein [Flavobacteriales bacterium]
MNNLKISILSILILTGILSSKAQTSFTLQEAIDYALINNKDVKNAELGIDAANKQKWETTATGLPQISGKVEYQRWLKQQTMLLPDFTGASNDLTPAVFGNKQTFTPTITATQLLFDGSYLVGLQSAKVFLAISKNQKEKTVLQVKEQVINAYGNVLMAKESVKITNQNIAALKKNLFETQEMFKNGLVEEENVEQLQITLGSLENNLNNLNRLVDIGEKMLNITMGRGLHDAISLTDDLMSLSIGHMNLDLASKSFSLNNNIDLKMAENNLKSKELLLKLERSKGMPSLTSFINLSTAGNSDAFTFHHTNQMYFASSLLGVSLNVPIFSSFKRTAANQRKRIELEQSQNDYDNLNKQLQLQLERAQSEYQFAMESLKTTKKNLKLAERIEAKNQIKFNEGIASSFDLRQAQTQLYSTQQEYIQSMQNVINKKATLETIINN